MAGSSPVWRRSGRPTFSTDREPESGPSPVSARRQRIWIKAVYQYGPSVIGVGIVIAVWFAIHPVSRFLPPPSSAWSEGVRLLGEPETYLDVLRSLRRLLIGLTAGYLMGFFVTLAGRASPWWRGFFSVYIYVAITTPSLAVALFCLTIFGLSEVSVYVAVAFVIFPFVVIGLNDGFESLDGRLQEMSRVYRLSKVQRLQHVAMPEMSPFLFATLRNVYALGWKIVVVTEVFSAQQDGIGAQYNRAYDFFALETLVVWVVFFLIVVFGVEFAVFRPWERRVFRWRTAQAG